jgi:hypothetical protein
MSRKKIIFYSLCHINNSRLNATGRELTEECPISWFERNAWADKEYTPAYYRCRIVSVVYADEPPNSQKAVREVVAELRKYNQHVTDHPAWTIMEEWADRLEGK